MNMLLRTVTFVCFYYSHFSINFSDSFHKYMSLFLIFFKKKITSLFPEGMSYMRRPFPYKTINNKGPDDKKPRKQTTGHGMQLGRHKALWVCWCLQKEYFTMQKEGLVLLQHETSPRFHTVYHWCPHSVVFNVLLGHPGQLKPVYKCKRCFR